MTLYFTSDWHIGHANCIEFDKRPFKDVHHMHRVLINNYNATVSPEDTCYFLGDVAMKSPPDVLNKIMMELNGTKILLLGNHDRGPSAMRRMGFDAVLNMAAITIANRLVTLSHCPLRGVFREDIKGMKRAVAGDRWHGESRYPQFSFPDIGQFHLHGHIHSGPHNSKGRTLGRQMDVGVVANQYRPVSQFEVESWIALTLKAEEGGVR